jgi:hypothetical protein
MEVNCNYCNNIFDYKGGVVHFNRNKRHYCSLNCLCKSNIIHGKARKNKDGKQDKRYRIWCNVKKRAKNKGIIFGLKIEDVPKIPKYCPVLGIKIKKNSMSSPLDSSPSLDRINVEKGYVVGNVRIISNRANRIKSDASINELRLILKDGEKNEKL